MYAEFLKDKRVALVGPGAQTEIMKLGSIIDSYDIVARVGHYNVLVPDEIGSRTDLILENFWFWEPKFELNMVGLYDEWVKQGTKWFSHVWCDNTGIHNFWEINKGRVPIQTQKLEKIQAIRNQIDSPTKGACAIYDLLTHPIKELFVVGYSFCKAFGYRKDFFDNPFKHPTWGVDYVDPKESVHNLDKWTVKLRGYDHPLDKELDWFKSVKQDSRVKCDEWLEQICA
jgi:hypothetical protein